MKRIVDLRSATIRRALLAEVIGTGLLATIVIGSGIAAQLRSPDETGLQLLYNAVATGAGLAALIAVFAPVSGAHFNPLVTVAMAVRRSLPWRSVAPFIAAQLIGACLGAMLANSMFGRDLVTLSTTERASADLWTSEVVASFALVVIIGGLSMTRHPNTTPAASGAVVGAIVGAFVLSAYWFTPSTAFMNPALTVARSLTDTFAGIAPSSVVPFIVAQCVGLMAALVTLDFLDDSNQPTEVLP